MSNESSSPISRPHDAADLPRVEEFSKRHHTAMLVVMFTDLEGSTELAEQRGEVHAQHVRERHNQLLREVVERDQVGECLKTIGDSLMCIFAEPTAAVERAVEIQDLLDRYNNENSDDSPIRVRIGLHVGQVVVEGHVQRDVFGRHVNRAARVESLAHAGQILMTHPVYDSASGWLAEKRLMWHDHGHYQLKGIPEPVRLLEVCPREGSQPRAPRGQRVRRHAWWPWIIGSAALLAAGVFYLLSLPPAPPLTARLNVQVVRDGQAGYNVAKTLPHQPSDQFIFVGELSESAYAAIFWIDAEGTVQLLGYRDGERNKEIRVPSDPESAVPITGAAGTDAILIVASRSALDTEEVKRQLAALGPPPPFDPEAPPHLVLFDDQATRTEPVYRSPGSPQPIRAHTPFSYCDKIRSLLRNKSLAHAGIALRHD